MKCHLEFRMKVNFSFNTSNQNLGCNKNCCLDELLRSCFACISFLSEALCGGGQVCVWWGVGGQGKTLRSADTDADT